MKINHFGTLYVVATPIGHLQDISFRAIDILKMVDFIAAEDTRHSQFLLQHYNINTPTLSLHEHNERERIQCLLQYLQEGKSIALISDAGTPLISDPGYALVQKAKIQGYKVAPIPGPCAAIAALSVAGLPTHRFAFEGFLPAKSKARLDHLTHLSEEPRTMIFYEAPHRILNTLEDMLKILGPERQVVLARELTKLFETIHSAHLSEMVEWVKKDPNQQRGEIVILIQGLTKPSLHLPYEEILTLLLTNLPVKQAVEIAVKITGKSKNMLYDIALQIKNNE